MTCNRWKAVIPTKASSFRGEVRAAQDKKAATMDQCTCRDAMEMVVDQLPSLVDALSEKDLHLLRRVLRSLSDIISRSEAALEAMR